MKGKKSRRGDFHMKREQSSRMSLVTPKGEKQKEILLQGYLFRLFGEVEVEI